MSRIVCPKCRANNMPGQTNCFQCGSSLPPPEAVPVPSYAPGPTAQPFQGAFPAPPSYRRRSAVWPIATAGIVIAALAGGLFLVRARSVRAPRTSAELSADMQAAELDQLRKAHGLGSSSQHAESSADDGTRQELNRLREKYGINTGNPHNPNDGSVPNGGAVTFDQWRREHPDPSNYQFH